MTDWSTDSKKFNFKDVGVAVHVGLPKTWRDRRDRQTTAETCKSKTKEAKMHRRERRKNETNCDMQRGPLC